jgi:hypothetical protein
MISKVSAFKLFLQTLKNPYSMKDCKLRICLVACFVLALQTLVNAQLISPSFNTNSKANLASSKKTIIEKITKAHPGWNFRQGKNFGNLPYSFSNGDSREALQIIGEDNTVKFFAWFSVFKKPFKATNSYTASMINAAIVAAGPGSETWLKKQFQDFEKSPNPHTSQTTFSNNLIAKIEFTSSYISLEIKV